MPKSLPVLSKRGPAPLSFSLGLAMAEYQASMARGEQPADPAAMLRGIRLYQDHPFARAMPLYETIWQSGQVRLLRHEDSSTIPRRTVLMVPSLINRPAIMDLLPRQSFMRFLEQAGYDAVLLDWGEPVDDAGMADESGLIRDRLAPALRFLSERQGSAVDVVGYCMGGLLSIAAVCLAPEAIRRLVLLGTPWDFHAGDPRMLNYVASGTPAAFQAMSDRGHLPRAWVQSIFAAMNADRAAGKFGDFAALDQDSEKARLFVAVEDWLNDGVDLPAGLARACIAEWYGENRPARAAWTIRGQVIDPRALTHHILVVAAQRDRLVAPESAEALVPLLRHGSRIRPDAGHIGMMTGTHARANVWSPVTAWLDTTPL